MNSLKRDIQASIAALNLSVGALRDIQTSDGDVAELQRLAGVALVEINAVLHSTTPVR